MPDRVFRPLTLQDLPHLRTLFEQTYVYEPVTAELIAEKTFGDPCFDDELTWVCETDRHLVGFIMGVTRPDYQPVKGWIKLLAVQPRFQGQGLGKQLYDRVEGNFSKRGLKTVSLFDTPYNYYTPGLDPRYTRALVFFQDRGFKRQGETENLLCSLAQDFDTIVDEQRLTADGIDIFPAENSDLERLNRWLDTLWPTWKFEAAAAQNQHLLYLAAKAEAIIGFGAGEGNNVGTGWFGPVGVDPRFRKLKIGKVLSLKVLADLKQRGFSMATIPWVGPIPFYQRLCGAVVDRVFWRFEKDLSGN